MSEIPDDVVASAKAAIARYMGSDPERLRLEAVSRAIMAERERQWQPIETAPKDGTMVLVFTNGHMDVTSWPENWGGKWPSAYMAYAEGLEPTHWMPLPAPPIRKGE